MIENNNIESCKNIPKPRRKKTNTISLDKEGEYAIRYSMTCFTLLRKVNERGFTYVKDIGYYATLPQLIEGYIDYCIKINHKIKSIEELKAYMDGLKRDMITYLNSFKLDSFKKIITEEIENE